MGDSSMTLEQRIEGLNYPIQGSKVVYNKI